MIHEGFSVEALWLRGVCAVGVLACQRACPQPGQQGAGRSWQELSCAAALGSTLVRPPVYSVVCGSECAVFMELPNVAII